MRDKIIRKSQTYHLLIHILLGIMCALFTSKYYVNENLSALLLLGAFGNVAPDIDHIIYYLTYGKDSEYSKIIQEFISEKDFKDVRKFLQENHKYLTGLYSHTLLSFFMSIALSLFLFKRSYIYSGVFFLSVTVHFLYDMVEDFLFFKKLNSNWFFKFNRSRKRI